MKSETSVVIVGAGPVGLLLAYQLSKFSMNDYIIVDKRENNTEVYGRACSIWPRTMELWDQLDLMEDMFAAGGVTTSTGFNFEDGKVVPGGLSFAHNMDRVGNTEFKFCFHLRQGMIEKVLRNKLKTQYGVEVSGNLELVGLDDRTLDDLDTVEGHPVTLRLKATKSDIVHEIDTKYVVGTDGGHSTVRKLSGIPFIGTKSGAKWVRMDAEVETDMPNPRCLNSIQSPTHGLVLFCPIDANLTRIGYVFSPALQQKWRMEDKNKVTGPIGTSGDGVSMSKDALIAEAKEAVKPFKLDFKRVDWYTIYGIGQCIAETFVKGHIILAGDACHTHSSGSAQGLNTGAQDAINLAWKLAFQIRDQTQRSAGLLMTYDQERRDVAQQVIANDAIIAALTSGDHPEKYAHRKDEDPRELLKEWCENMENLQFTLGLGVTYPASCVVKHSSGVAAVSTALPGQRGPDGPLTKLGTGEVIRLHTILPNTGCFYIIVFAGNVQRPRPTHQCDPFTTSISTGPITIKYLTIVAGAAMDSAELLSSAMPVGRVYLDVSRKTHDAYGIDCEAGGVVVLRPDGYIGTVLSLAEDLYGPLLMYLQEFSQ